MHLNVSQSPIIYFKDLFQYYLSSMPTTSQYILCYSYRALSSVKHKTLNQKKMYSYYFLYIIYNPCKPVQHVSIPSWDHHQGHL
jgi:hypothetical protein